MRTLLAAAVLFGCNGGSGTIPDDGGTTPPTDTDLPTTDTGTTTVPTTLITTEPPALSDFSSTLDDDQRSIVIVSWSQDGPANVVVEFGVDGEEVRTTPVRTLDAGPHEELLLGLPYDVGVTWRVVASTATGTTEGPYQDAATDPLPGGFPEGLLETSDPSAWDPDMDYVVTSVSGSGTFGGTWWLMILDRQGRTVWARVSPDDRVSWYPRVNPTGTSLLLDANSYWATFDGGAASEIVEMKIDGTVVEAWPAPGLHHSFTQLPDGSLAWGSYVGGLGAYEENVLVMDPAGNVDVVMQCGDWLDSIGERTNMCGSNTVYYHEPTNHLLVSWFTFEAITEIDLANNEVVRTFGHVNGAYDFSPANSAFWYQHGPTITDDGNLVVSTHVSDFDDELVVREYEVDDATDTLVEVWNVGVGQGVTGQQMGEAHRLPSGNTLHNFGTNAHLREYTTDGDVVWEMDWALESSIGRSEPILVDLYDLAPDRP